MGNERMEEAVEHYARLHLCLCLRLQVSFRHYVLRRLRLEDEKWSLTRLLVVTTAEHIFTVMSAVVFVSVYVPTETQLIVFHCLGRNE